MIKLSKVTAASIVAASLVLTGCGSSSSSDSTPNTNTPDTNTSTSKVVSLSGAINADMDLNASNVYKIDGKVTVEDGATLTIPAGTTLYGATASSFLVIKQGAQIDAQGTAVNPIIFTSKEDFEGKNNGYEQGQWGGLTLLGKAQYNKGVNQPYEADSSLTFGGTDDTDNSGTLKYVVVKHTGYEVATDAELNGISFGGVGSGTTVENIAVIGGKDDGIELWGGTVNLKNVYVFNAGDDSLDTDNGYRGTVTNAYLEQYKTLSSDPRGIEADSRSTDTAGSVVSKLTVNGMTLVTAHDAKAGIRLREGTAADFNNTVVISNNGPVLKITDPATESTNDISFTNSSLVVVDGSGIKGDDANLTDAEAAAYFGAGSNGNELKTLSNSGADMTQFEWIQSLRNVYTTDNLGKQ